MRTNFVKKYLCSFAVDVESGQDFYRRACWGVIRKAAFLVVGVGNNHTCMKSESQGKKYFI